MQANIVYKLFLKVQSGTLEVGKLQTAEGVPPKGEASPEQPVPAHVIGYWIELADKAGRVLYRRFLHNTLPFNLLAVVPAWSERRRTRTRFVIELPVVANATRIELFEQSLASPGQSVPERHRHLSYEFSGNGL